MDYRIKIDVFEGPFDLLLHLVKLNEMDIYDIRIAEITNHYLEYIRMMQELDLELAGDFLVMAATLVAMKARSLLPQTPYSDEQEEEIDNYLSARELIRQLVEYRRFKDLSAVLSAREADQLDIYYRRNIVNPYVESVTKEKPLEGDLTLLLDAFSNVLRFIKQEGVHHVVEEIFTVEDKIAHVESILARTTEISAYELFRNCFSKIEIIVTFLAILELCRLKRVFLSQSRMFEDIRICRWKEEEISVG